MGSRLERRFKTHAHLLVFTGALVVFLTYVIKEGLGDHWKATAEAVKEAQYMYAVNGQRSGTNLWVTQLQRDIRENDMWNGSGKRRIEATKRFMSDDYMLLTAISNLSNIRILISDMNTLTAILPNNDPKIKEVDNLGNDADQLRKDQFECAQELRKEGNKRTEQLLLKYTASVDGTNAIQIRTTFLQRDLMEEAEHIKNKEARYSRISWWISAFLFAVGWGLGLLGKLYGMPEVAGGD